MNQPNDNRVAVVTGSSSGIGRATALRLARSGFDVLIHAGQNQAGADKVKQAVLEKHGDTCDVTVVVHDFSETDRLPEFARRCWQWKNNVDIWVNNAGADVLTGSAAEQSFAEKLQRVLQIDVVSTLVLSRFVGRRMQSAFGNDNKIRSIVNIGWDQAEHGMAGDSGEMFAASKGAIMACSKSLAQSLAPAVRVNCVAPGWVQTQWGQQASSKWQERARKESLLDRWGQPEDIAAIIDFLASPAGQFVNGQVINVNGGFRHSM